MHGARDIAKFGDAAHNGVAFDPDRPPVCVTAISGLVERLQAVPTLRVTSVADSHSCSRVPDDSSGKALVAGGRCMSVRGRTDLAHPHNSASAIFRHACFASTEPAIAVGWNEC